MDNFYLFIGINFVFDENKLVTLDPSIKIKCKYVTAAYAFKLVSLNPCNWISLISFKSKPHKQCWFKQIISVWELPNKTLFYLLTKSIAKEMSQSIFLTHNSWNNKFKLIKIVDKIPNGSEILDITFNTTLLVITAQDKAS